MSIKSIESVFRSSDNNRVYVTAVIDDFVLTHEQTLYDPPEYGPALCESSFELYDDYSYESEEDLIDLLDNLNVEWNLVSEEEY